MSGWRRLAPLVACACAAALAGCGLGVPLGASTGRPNRQSAAPPVTDNELTTPPGPTEHARGSSSAVTAIRLFTETYINWTAADVDAHLRELESASVGQARTALALELAQTRVDPELRQAGLANHGSVEAIAPLAGASGRWVVVTRESTTATGAAYAGLGPAWHLALVGVSRRAGRWVVSGFEPQS